MYVRLHIRLFALDGRQPSFSRSHDYYYYSTAMHDLSIPVHYNEERLPSSSCAICQHLDQQSRVSNLVPNEHSGISSVMSGREE